MCGETGVEMPALRAAAVHDGAGGSDLGCRRQSRHVGERGCEKLSWCENS